MLSSTNLDLGVGRFIFVFLGMDWLRFLLGIGCLLGAAALAARKVSYEGLEGRLERLERAAPLRRASWVLLGVAAPLSLAILKVAQYHTFGLNTDTTGFANNIWNLAHGHGFVSSLG